MLTNWGTISNSIKKLNKIHIDLSTENRGFTKKELLKMSGQRDKLQRSLGGIAEMKKVPDLISRSLLVSCIRYHYQEKYSNSGLNLQESNEMKYQIRSILEKIKKNTADTKYSFPQKKRIS